MRGTQAARLAAEADQFTPNDRKRAVIICTCRTTATMDCAAELVRALVTGTSPVLRQSLDERDRVAA